MNLEDLIDKKLELLSSEGDTSVELISSIENKFEVLFDYLQDGFGEELNEEEFEMLLFTNFIILACAGEMDSGIEFDPEKYSEEEENGFKLLEENNSRDVFSFEYGYKYLELFHFTEDYLDGLEEEGINRVIQNIIFVVSVSLLKSL